MTEAKSKEERFKIGLTHNFTYKDKRTDGTVVYCANCAQGFTVLQIRLFKGNDDHLTPCCDDYCTPNRPMTRIGVRPKR